MFSSFATGAFSKGTFQYWTPCIFRDMNFLMPDYELPQIKRVKLLKFFVAKTLYGDLN